MKIEYDRQLCGGWFQCVQEWDAFDMNMAEGKADLQKAELTNDGAFVREIPDDVREEAKAAAEVCPVDAIIVYDEGGEQIVP